VHRGRNEVAQRELGDKLYNGIFGGRREGLLEEDEAEKDARRGWSSGRRLKGGRLGRRQRWG
jgi:hypothetical protein